MYKLRRLAREGNSSLLEMRIKMKKGASRTKARHSGFNPMGIEVIIELLVVTKPHPVGKALSERSDDLCGVEPQPEPPIFILQRRIQPAAQQARWFVPIREPGFQLVSTAPRHQDQRMEVVVARQTRVPHHSHRNHPHHEPQSPHFSPFRVGLLETTETQTHSHLLPAIHIILWWRTSRRVRLDK